MENVIRKEVVCNALHNYLFTGKELGFFNKENQEYINKRVNDIKTIIFDERIKGDVITNMDEVSNPVIIVNPSLFKKDYEEQTRILFREFTRILCGIRSGMKTNNSLLTKMNMQMHKNSKDNVDPNKKIYCKEGLLLLEEAICNNVTEDMMSYKKREVRPAKTLTRCPFAQVQYKTNFKENEVSQEISENFAASFIDSSKDDASESLNLLAVQSFSDDIIKKIVLNHDTLPLFNHLCTTLNNMGIVYTNEFKHNNDEYIPYYDFYTTATAYNTVKSDLSKTNIKNLTSKTNKQFVKVNC